MMFSPHYVTLLYSTFGLYNFARPIALVFSFDCAVPSLFFSLFVNRTANFIAPTLINWKFRFNSSQEDNIVSY
jgi:hypothetical protein